MGTEGCVEGRAMREARSMGGARVAGVMRKRGERLSAAAPPRRQVPKSPGRQAVGWALSEQSPLASPFIV